MSIKPIIKLTTIQKEFLLDNFFKNEKYPGWKSIASELLDKGQCIVAGNYCIWYGGIGNFIKTEPTKDAIDCTTYIFDLEYFLTSEWYKEIKNLYLDDLMIKQRELARKITEIEDL